MAEKIKAPTKREMYDYIISKNAEDTKIVEFCEKQKELLERKASKVDTKKSAEHEELIGLIKAVLYKADKPMTCSEIMKAVNTENETEHSLPKISAMLTKMGEKGTNEVEKFTEKKVSYFRLAEWDRGLYAPTQKGDSVAKKIKKIFLKPIDKVARVWYNIGVEKRGDTNERSYSL